MASGLSRHGDHYRDGDVLAFIRWLLVCHTSYGYTPKLIEIGIGS